MMCEKDVIPTQKKTSITVGKSENTAPSTGSGGGDVTPSTTSLENFPYTQFRVNFIDPFEMTPPEKFRVEIK